MNTPVSSETPAPHHVAIIPDGNRRWAKAHGLEALQGHRKGTELADALARHARERGVKVLTVWAFSTENWGRMQSEIGYLMDTVEAAIERHMRRAKEEKMRVIHLGRKDRIRESLRKKIEAIENDTKEFDDFYLCVALDYGGADEIERAHAKSISTGKALAECLDTAVLPYPSPDLIIRTGGEKRTSGFMGYQSGYAELIFSDILFPDFSTSEFDKCIDEYDHRQRRFGK